MTRILGAIVVLLMSSAIACVPSKGESDGSVPVIAQSTDTVETVSDTMEGYSSASVAGVTLQWKVDGEKISVQVSAPTTGWIAVGFDPSKQKADASIIIGYVVDGEVFLRDDFGISNTQHGADVDNGGTDDLSNVEGGEVDGVTTISFTMPLDTGDALDRPLVPGSSYTVLMAYGSDRADNFATYHGRGNRGSVMIEL